MQSVNALNPHITSFRDDIKDLEIANLAHATSQNGISIMHINQATFPRKLLLTLIVDLVMFISVVTRKKTANEAFVRLIRLREQALKA